MRRGPGGGEGEWAKRREALVDVGAAAYKAARAKDGNALVALNQTLNAACNRLPQTVPLRTLLDRASEWARPATRRVSFSTGHEKRMSPGYRAR